MLKLKIIFLKKYYFNIFLNKKYFKKHRYFNYKRLYNSLRVRHVCLWLTLAISFLYFLYAIIWHVILSMEEKKNPWQRTTATNTNNKIAFLDELVFLFSNAIKMGFKFNHKKENDNNLLLNQFSRVKSNFILIEFSTNHLCSYCCIHGKIIIGDVAWLHMKSWTTLHRKEKK